MAIHGYIDMYMWWEMTFLGSVHWNCFSLQKAFPGTVPLLRNAFWEVFLFSETRSGKGNGSSSHKHLQGSVGRGTLPGKDEPFPEQVSGKRNTSRNSF